MPDESEIAEMDISYLTLEYAFPSVSPVQARQILYLDERKITLVHQVNQLLQHLNSEEYKLVALVTSFDVKDEHVDQVEVLLKSVRDEIAALMTTFDIKDAKVNQLEVLLKNTRHVIEALKTALTIKDEQQDSTSN